MSISFSHIFWTNGGTNLIFTSNVSWSYEFVYFDIFRPVEYSAPLQVLQKPTNQENQEFQNPHQKITIFEDFHLTL